jgi:L-threonylcarbamoyladenylate synthase
MRLIRVDPRHPDPAVLAEAGAILRAGGMVAFPTETVYGLGANALDAAAVARIFEAKGRPAYNPLIAHVSSEAAARALASVWTREAELLAERFWPGPLTLVVPRAEGVPDLVTAGLPTVALRVPGHPVAHALLEAAGVPIAAPSANRFTALSPTTAAHVAKGLGERVDLILDGGPTAVGIESTVLDISAERPVLLRPGTISIEAIEAVVGPVGRAAAIAGEAARPGPGMIERHYSPRAELRLFPFGATEALRAAAAEAERAGRRPGTVLLGGAGGGASHARHLPADPGLYARELYSTLHELDDLGCDLILVEGVPEGPAWAGVRDRLRRASHPA